jgi:arginine decarboxylase
MCSWSIEDALQAYNFQHWSDGYFGINADGHVVARSLSDDSHPGVDLYQLASAIHETGLSLPVLVRVTDILHDRVHQLNQAFMLAMDEREYLGSYTSVYPIKVNQQRTVVEHIVASETGNVGLEAGSKPELMVVLALADANGGTVICNGYKDREYVRLALIGRQLGYRIFIVIEKLSELRLVLEEAQELGIKPLLGVRLRLASIGKGKWQNTGGEKSKFGLSSAQVLEMVETLRAHDALDALQLIHCHMGSQLANIRDIQHGLAEISRYFVELSRTGANIQVIDVGGGLGIDYEGTRSRSFCSMNYSIQQYARDVVNAFCNICSEENLPHPDIITESGRAMTAHHAFLITNVIDHEQPPSPEQLPEPGHDDPTIMQNMWDIMQHISSRSALESYHDAAYWLSEAHSMFTHGVLSLDQRAQVENYYFAVCQRVLPMLQASARSHREVIDDLNEKLANKYFINLSIFQSVPDVWAIDQIFPIIPLHRLNEKPTIRATLHDLTCDSDGAIDHYVDQQSVESTLQVHALKNNEPYLLGIFLVGAYQEILGDMHNLFGDTHSINLEFSPDGSYQLVEPEFGDNVDDVLSYVHYSPESLLTHYQEKIAAARITGKKRKKYLEELEAGLSGYTYLED